MRDRAIGIENEYGAILQLSDGEYDSESIIGELWASGLLHNGMIAAVAARPACGLMPASRLWLPNGGCVYIDNAAQVEYASPEARRFREVVCHNKAGERFLAELFPPDTQGAKIIFLKNNIGEDAYGKKTTYGCHENYLSFGLRPGSTLGNVLGEDSELWRYFLPLIAFLVTRQIVDGAGCWLEPERDVYGFSQRASFIEKVFDTSANSTRPIINTRYEDHMRGCDDGFRLHLVLGDANILEYALYLKVGTTALVLSMCEDNAFPALLSEIDKPLEAMGLLSRSHNPHARVVKFKDKVERSPLEVQAMFAAAARKYCRATSFESEESEAEANAICDEWEKTLNALARNDIQWLVGRIDHVTKRFLADAHIARAGADATEKRKAELRKGIDLAYHDISFPPRALATILARSPEKRIVSDRDITRAQRIPPADTRAYARGMLVKRYCKKDRWMLADLNWDYVTVKQADGFNKSFCCGNPLCATPPWLSGFLKGKPPMELADNALIPPTLSDEETACLYAGWD